MSENQFMTTSKILKTRSGMVAGPYVLQSPPKCVPYPPVYGYMYTSAPKAVGQPERPRKSRPSRKSDRGLIPGEYFNMMFDPRVYRGSTFQEFKDTEKNRCIKAEKQVERRDILKKRKAFRPTQYKMGGIIRPRTPQQKHRNLDREVTELFLTEHLEKVAQSNQQMQTEVDQPLLAKQKYMILETGMNKCTQVEDWDLFDFEEEIHAISPVLTEKIIEQALTEVMEEEDQLFVRGAWAIAHQKLHVAQSHIDVLRNQEKEFAAKAEARRLELYQEELDNQELEESVGCMFFAQSYMSQMNSNLTALLHKEGTLTNLSYQVIKDHFEPWLSKEVRKECIRSKITTSLVDDIIISVVKYRAAAVLGDLGLEIDFRGTMEDDPITHICQQRDLVMSDSNPSDFEEMGNNY